MATNLKKEFEAAQRETNLRESLKKNKREESSKVKEREKVKSRKIKLTKEKILQQITKHSSKILTSKIRKRK